MTEAKKTIVYVDDEQELIDLVGMILRLRGFRVVGALGGCEGLEVIRRVKPDLVLLDLMMPDMSGDQVYRCLKNDNTLKHIPVVITTADAAQKTRTLYEQLLKANGFVPKPFSLRELADTIERALYPQPNEMGRFAT
jgi:CheY-like chemotaxis protein